MDCAVSIQSLSNAARNKFSGNSTTTAKLYRDELSTLLSRTTVMLLSVWQIRASVTTKSARSILLLLKADVRDRVPRQENPNRIVGRKKD